MLLGVDHHDVGGLERGGVDQPQQLRLQAAVEAAVLGGARRADQVVEHQRHLAAAVQQPREVYVEVTKVTDDHGVRPAKPAGPHRQPQPAASEPGDKAAGLPRLRQHVDPVGGGEPERDVALGHVEPAGGQALGNGRDARMHRGVVSTEDDCAHDVRTLWHRASTGWAGPR